MYPYLSCASPAKFVPNTIEPPPLGGLPPPHGAFQEHAAHLVEWSTTLSSKGSSGTCMPEVLPHSSMPLSRRTARDERTLAGVGWTPLIMIEASPAAYPDGMLALGKTTHARGGDLLCGGSCQAFFIVSPGPPHEIFYSNA